MLIEIFIIMYVTSNDNVATNNAPQITVKATKDSMPKS